MKECLGYFKVTLGTGIKEPAPCHCHYCRRSGELDTFYGQEQIDYAHSVIMRKVTDAFVEEDWDEERGSRFLNNVPAGGRSI